MVVYTQEHKTSAVGLRREQYLPLARPVSTAEASKWLRLLLAGPALTKGEITAQPCMAATPNVFTPIFKSTSMAVSLCSSEMRTHTARPFQRARPFSDMRRPQGFIVKTTTECGKKLSEVYKELGRVLTFRYPKRLICFPNTEGRLRTREQVIERLDEALKRARR
eukprot:g30480.t1